MNSDWAVIEFWIKRLVLEAYRNADYNVEIVKIAPLQFPRGVDSRDFILMHRNAEIFIKHIKEDAYKSNQPILNSKELDSKLSVMLTEFGFREAIGRIISALAVGDNAKKPIKLARDMLQRMRDLGLDADYYEAMLNNTIKAS